MTRLPSFALPSAAAMQRCVSICRALLPAALALLVGGPLAAATLQVTPARVKLLDSHDRRQVAVTLDGVDVTRQVRFESSQAGVCTVDPHGLVLPVGQGTARVRVVHSGAEAELDVEVADIGQSRPIDFKNEIIPLLTRYGCNSGGCHGKSSGQNGFKLSLFGFDPARDYQALAKEGRGRRVSPAAPLESLLLRKATGAVPHGGGARFAADSEACAVLRDWIAAGLPEAGPAPREIISIQVEPTDKVLQPGQSHQLSVLARYSDGLERDVTRQAQFETNADPVAVVDTEGYISTAGSSGEAAIMVRYQSKVAVLRVIVPHGPVRDSIPGFVERNYIDHLAAEKWKRLGLLPSPLASDGQFLRRVTLDLCGRLPSVDETRAYLADQSADKRDQLVDRLLASPDYAAYFALRWGSILRNSPKAGAEQASYAFHNWIRDMIAQNRPYDEFVRGIVAASGEWADAPAINWYWQMRDDQLHQVAADTAQVFLGVRLQCARCHHHPYERYSQGDYYGLAGFFSRVGRKSFGEPPPYYSSSRTTYGDVNPETGKPMEAKYLDGELARCGPLEDPRHALVDWMAKDDNPYFARTLVNRLWGHLFSRGLVEPVDDMRDSNPPSNPELLAALARDFVAHKFDVKYMLRTMATSNLYALDSEPTDDNRKDGQNFARYYGRRLIAEVFLDAVDQASGSASRFSGMAASARAVDLPHEGFGSDFLDAFNRPKRETGCECERSSAATLSQVLLLANSESIENKLADGNARLAQRIKEKKSNDEILDELYLASFSRHPLAPELSKPLHYLSEANEQERQQILQDVLWAILNSKEFSYNH